MIIEHSISGRREFGCQEPWYPLSNVYFPYHWSLTDVRTVVPLLANDLLPPCVNKKPESISCFVIYDLIHLPQRIGTILILYNEMNISTSLAKSIVNRHLCHRHRASKFEVCRGCIH